MIKVGFILNFPLEYKGGINYFKNLFFAIGKFKKDQISIVLFVPENLNEEYLEMFRPYVEIISTKILQRKSISWFISRGMEKCCHFDPLTLFLLQKHKVDCVSHSNYVYPFKSIKTINWIPDFQYLYYPKLWTAKQLKETNKLHRRWVENSDIIVVSSYSAKTDLESIYPAYSSKTRVLHFVSQPNTVNSAIETSNTGKYITENFFYVPNQFWSHKNHLVIFKAITILKKQGLKINLVASGLMHDYRTKDKFFNSLKSFIDENEIEDQIKFLGIIPYRDVLDLIRGSVAVINPSYFEGWSSSVEESRSIGKTIVMSDIPVHREQNPKGGIFFNPDNELELAGILGNLWENAPPATATPQDLAMDLAHRTKAFADNYYAIISEPAG